MKGAKFSKNYTCRNARFPKAWLFVLPHSKMLSYVVYLRCTQKKIMGQIFFDKIHMTHHFLKHVNTLHIQMAKVAVPKLEHAIFH